MATITTFTPSPSCLTDYYITSTSYNNFLYTWLRLGPDPTSDCFPKNWAPTSQFFSPAACPVGYTIACSQIGVDGTEAETQATCCPSHYSCQNGGGGETYNWYSTALCTRGNSDFTPESIIMATRVFDNGTTVITPQTQTGHGGVNAYAVSVRFRAEDTAMPTSTADSTFQTSVSGSSSPEETAPSTTTPSGTSGGGLSVGAKAGIGATVGVCGLAAFLVLGFILLRRRRRTPPNPVPAPEPAKQGYYKPDGSVNAQSPFLPPQGAPQYQSVHEVPQSNLAYSRQELPAEPARHELPSQPY